MLRRAGFGATGPQIDAVVNQDWSAYLDEALDLDPDTDAAALATPRPMPVSPAVPADGAGDAALQEFTRTLFDQMTDLTSWWVRRMAAVHEPVHEKPTLLWHNHFARSAQKVPAAVDGQAEPEAAHPQTRRFPHARLRDVDRLGDAVLAGRRSQQRRRGERESVPRVHGALHARTRKKMYAKGPARSPVGSSAQWARPRSPPATTTAPTRP